MVEVSKWWKCVTLRCTIIFVGFFIVLFTLAVFTAILGVTIAEYSDKVLHAVHRVARYVSGLYCVTMHSTFAGYLVFGAIKQVPHFVFSFAIYQGLFLGTIVGTSISMIVKYGREFRPFFRSWEILLTGLVIFSFLASLNYYKRFPKRKIREESPNMLTTPQQPN